MGFCAALAGVLVLAAVAPARAQETVNYASVAGRVTNASGAAVKGAQVSIRQTETNVVATAESDEGGRFRFPYLHVGPYELTVTHDGFKTDTRTLSLSAGSAFDLGIKLELGAVEAHVTVSADATVLETARSQVSTTIQSTEIRSLPLNGRNFLDLALFTPGASPTNVGGGTQLFPETSAVPGVGLSFSSQRNLSNNFMVDGLSNNDDAAALSGIVYGVDAIDQFQVVTSGGQAELGRALGGDVNVITRSGTNQMLGSGYEFFRNNRLNAPNALSGTTLPMNQNEYGASAGGPIRRDRTFFFMNVEQRRLVQSGLVTIPDSSVASIDTRLAATGYQGPGVATGVYPTPIDSTTFLLKLDHQFSSADAFSARYSAYHISSANSRGAGGTSAPSASAGLDNLDQTIAFGNVRTLSANAVLETRGQFAYSNLSAPPADPVGPAVSISGVASFGTLSGSPTARTNDLTEIVNNLSVHDGDHALKAGVDLQYNADTITFPRSIRGSYSFSSLANFLSGNYTTFTQTFGTSAVHQTNPNTGFYFQDEWTPSSHVTINGGVRYDLQFLQTIATDTNNLSPRLGVVWSPGKSGRNVIRVSGGRYFDRIALRALANALLSAGNTTDLTKLQQSSIVLSPGQTGAPVFPAILTQAVASTALVSFSTMDPHMQEAYSDQGSIEWEHVLGRGATLAVGYDHLRGHDLIMQVNQNVPTCAVSGSNNGCRPISTYANNSQYSSVGSSVYDGLHVSLVQRPTSWGSYRVSYTLSKAMDNEGEAFFNAPIDNFDLSKDWGRSDDDQRHRLVVSGTANTPRSPGSTPWQRITHGFEVTCVVQFYSALPYNITTGGNTIQATAARPMVNGVFIPRNSGIGSDFSSVNLRIGRTFHTGPRATLELLAEAFNLLNTVNDVARITVFGSGAYPTNPAANFGQITVIGDPRSVQLGLRFQY